MNLLILPIITILLACFLGLVVFFQNFKSRKNRILSVLSFLVAFWTLSVLMADLSKSHSVALFWTKMSIVGPALIAFFLLWFSIVFPLDKRIPKSKLFFAFMPSLLIIILAPTRLNVTDIKIESWGTEFTPGPLYWGIAVLLAVYITWSFINIIKSYKKSSGIERYQIKYLFIGVLISITLGVLLNLILPSLGYSRASSLGPSTTLFFIGFTGYAITRYRLMDIRIIIRKIFIYFLESIFVYGLFYLIAGIYLKFFGGIFNNTSYLIGIFIAIGFVTLFSLFNALLKNVSKKYFFKNLTDYQNSLIFLSQELNKYNDLDQIINLIVDTIKSTMNLNRAGVLLVNVNEKPIHYQIAKTIGFNEQNGISLVQDNFLTQYLQKTKNVLLLDELSLLSRDAKTKKDAKGFSDLKGYMEHIEASLCLPLMSNNNLIGIVVLGAKLSKDAYTKEDLELLSALGSQASIAIENARLYDEINDKKRELDKFNRELKYKVEEQTKDIKEKNRHLEELLNMKSDFLRTVNHQLNTPLSIMKNAFSMMEDKSLEIDRGLEIASSGLERMSSTISDFWDAFELEGQKIKMALIETDIEKIINDMIKEKKNLKLATTRNLKINFIKPYFAIPKVLCDQKKITHVISNLLDNAVFYTEKGSINVGFEKINKNNKEFLKVLVSDTGCGISEEDKEKLFTKFSRGSAASSIHPDGSGLGLYIAKSIVEDSGGELKLENSEIGKGTTFSFTLQVSNVKLTNQEPINNVKPVIKSMKINNCSVLFIEDEKSIVELYKIYFEKHGYDFYSTYDLDEAKDILKTKKIDVVVLDIIIRKKEKDGMINVVAEQGYSFLETVKKDKSLKNIPVIMFTNLNTDQDRSKAKKLGASDYVFKGSAKPQDLINAINRVV